MPSIIRPTFPCHLFLSTSHHSNFPRPSTPFVTNLHKMEELCGAFEDLAPIRPTEHLGASDMTFDRRLQTNLQIYEDGGASGCGGKVWIAGELLSKYVLDNDFRGRKKVVEIGSGTGLVGLALGLSAKRDDDMKVYITDIDDLVPLMHKNIQLNHLENTVEAATLSWGEPLPEYAQEGIDMILAADCVYLEKGFPLLEKTLLDLTEKDDPLVLMAYRKRRKADGKFFRKIRKNFTIVPITDFDEYEMYLKQSCTMFQLVRKPRKQVLPEIIPPAIANVISPVIEAVLPVLPVLPIKPLASVVPSIIATLPLPRA